MLQQIDDYLKAENYSSALKKAKKIFNHPQFGEAAYQRAIFASKKLKNRVGTLALCKKAIIAFPNNDYLLQEYGGFSYEIGKYSEAITAYQMILKHHPEDAVTLSNVISCYIALQEPDKAEEFINRLIFCQKAVSNTYNILGGIRLGKDDIVGAEIAFRTALFGFPATTTSAYNYLQFCERHNAFHKFEEVLLQISDEIKNDATVSLQIGKLYARQGKIIEAIEIFAKILLQRQSLDRVICKKTLFEYGKALDKKGLAKEAFEAFLQGNEIAKKTLEGSFKRSQKDLIDLQNGTSIQGPTVEQNPVFVLGFPRTGTTLIDQVLSTLGHVKTFEETAIISLLLESQITNIKAGKELNRRRLQEQYFKFYKENFDWQMPQILVDRSAPNIANICFIRSLFPNAKIVVLHRHPLDIVLSCYMQDFELNILTREFTQLGSIVSLYTSVMDSLASLEGDPSIYNLRYEDLVSNFDKETRSLFEFLGLEWTDGVRSFHDTALQKRVIRTASYQQVTKPLYATAVGRWKSYQDVFLPYLAILEPYAQKLGYDFNMD